MMYIFSRSLKYNKELNKVIFKGDLDQAGTMRNLLHTEWATLKKWYTYQPLDYVKEYFGIKIALYFAWLGFYTHMLVPAAVVGLICFIYSCCTIYQYKPR